MRLLQEAIEAALDINAHLIAEQGAPVPEDYYGGFLAIGTLGVIHETLARELAPSAGLRNRLVQEYDDRRRESTDRDLYDARALSSFHRGSRGVPQAIGPVGSGGPS